MIPQHFLDEGLFSKQDFIVTAVANELKQKAVSPLEALNSFVYNYNFNKVKVKDSFRKRTASEILYSGLGGDCSDAALIYCTLSRALGIPTKFVELVELEWLDQWINNAVVPKINIHPIVELYIDGEWKRRDPYHNEAIQKDYLLFWNMTPFIKIGEGLDFSEIYLKKEETYLSTPTSLLTEQDIIAALTELYERKPGAELMQHQVVF